MIISTFEQTSHFKEIISQIKHHCKLIMWLCEDTVYDAAALDVSALGKVKLDEFSEATGVVVVNGFGISKRFHDGTAEGKTLSFHLCQFKPTSKTLRECLELPALHDGLLHPGAFLRRGCPSRVLAHH